jgi:hypothetical protein
LFFKDDSKRFFKAKTIDEHQAVEPILSALQPAYKGCQPAVMRGAGGADSCGSFCLNYFRNPFPVSLHVPYSARIPQSHRLRVAARARYSGSGCVRRLRPGPQTAPPQVVCSKIPGYT